MKKDKKRCYAVVAAALLLGVNVLAGCGSAESENAQPADLTENVQDTGDAQGTDTGDAAGEAAETDSVKEASGIVAESAKDAQVDFVALKAENPDIFAWIYIPGTQIDYPVLQSEEADDFYENHNAYGEDDTAGAVYIELANRFVCGFIPFCRPQFFRET